MATSDSEAFESADEDLLDVNTNKSKKSSANLNVDNVDHASKLKTKGSKDDENNLVTKTRKESTDDEFKEAPESGKRSKERPRRQPIERKPKQVSKLGVKVQKPDVKPADAISEDVNVNKNVCAQVEDKEEDSDTEWNDFNVESEQSDNIPSKIAKQPVETAKSTDADGWDDGFEDWEEDDSPENHISSSCNVTHSDNEFKALADRLSSLGEGSSGSKVDSGSSGAGGSWGGWGGWGASLLSSGVSQLTSHVSQGFSTVSNVIESGMGVPDPEELVRMQKAAKEKEQIELEGKTENIQNQPEALNKSVQRQNTNEEENADGDIGGFKFGKLMSSVTKLVETTGTAVVTGGLDTLEEIGKRTMKVIQGDEPGGRVKLSTLLREARDRVDEVPPRSSDDFSKKNKKTPRFEALFDDYQGLVHLEALEMLSKQCDMKINSLLVKTHGTELIELKETLAQVKDICELPDPDDEDDDSDGKLDVESFKAKLTEATKDLGVTLNFSNILSSWEETLAEANEPIEEGGTQENEADGKLKIEESAEDLSHSAISNMAKSSALSVQILHKATALLSVKERRSTADEADGLTQLTAVLSSHIGEVAAVYSQKLHKFAQLCDNSEKVNQYITNVFFEARKGSSYLHDAFLLTIPILQVGAT